MNKSFKIVTGSLLAVIAASSIGCGQGMKSNTSSNAKASGGNIANTEEIAAVIKKAEKASDEAQAAIVEAQSVLLTIQDQNGNIKIDLFQRNNGQVDSAGLLTPVIDRLRGPFDTVLAKVALVKSKFNEARQMLVTSLSKLDDKDPAQAALINEVMKQMAAIDRMEAQFRTSMMQLGGKLDMAVAALEKLISGVTNFLPGWGWVVNLGLDYLVMSDIRDFVAEIKMKLMAL
jgi:hypothetical protein